MPQKYGIMNRIKNPIEPQVKVRPTAAWSTEEDARMTAVCQREQETSPRNSIQITYGVPNSAAENGLNPGSPFKLVTPCTISCQPRRPIRNTEITTSATAMITN